MKVTFGNKRFKRIERDDELLRAPIPDDPLGALREEWAEVDELNRTANEQAEQDAGR